MLLIAREVGKIEFTNRGQLGPAPWAEGDLDNAAAPIVHDDAIATPDLINQRIRTGLTVSVLLTGLVQIGSHAATAKVSHASGVKKPLER